MKGLIKILFLLTFFFSKCSFVHTIEDNYIELKKIEKKLRYNEKNYKKLQKIEKSLNKDIQRFDYNNKKYEYLIQKGFNEKTNLEKIIKDDKAELKEINKTSATFDVAHRRLLEIIIVDEIIKDKDLIRAATLESVYNKLFILKDNYRKEIADINNNIKINEIELSKINMTLNNIRSKVQKSSSKIEGVLGKSIITAIQKEEKKIEKKYIKRRALKLKKLIERLEKNNKNKTSKKPYFLADIKDLLPVGKLSVENIRTDKLKTGILLTLKKDSLIKAPQDGLVVYADLFKGYGNMVIIDLGNNYHLIFSGLNSIFCKTGDWIAKGGILGDMGVNLKNNDLYMEVRFKGKTISPKRWASS